MDEANKFGPISPSTKDFGKMICNQEEGDSSVAMEMSTKANGRIPSLMGREF